MNSFPIAPEKYRNVASKAVSSYVKKQYSKYFTNEDIEDMVSDVTLRMWRAKDSFDTEKGMSFSGFGLLQRMWLEPVLWQSITELTYHLPLKKVIFRMIVLIAYIGGMSLVPITISYLKRLKRVCLTS